MGANIGEPNKRAGVGASSGGWEWLRARRLKAGLSQTDFGRVAGVGQTAVSAWEKLERRPSGDSFEKLAIALGVKATTVYIKYQAAQAKERGGVRR